MKSQIYAIFDMASGVYEKPFFSPADEIVKREFLNVAVQADTPISRHPKDYSLWRLGNFDDNTGLVQDENNECLCTAMEIIAQSQHVDKKQMNLLEANVKASNSQDYPPGLTD